MHRLWKSKLNLHSKGSSVRTEHPRCVQISQSQWELIWHPASRLQDQHMIWVFLNIFNRVHVNTPIESCKWSSDSRPAKPHCQKILMRCAAQKKKAHPVPPLTTLCQSKTHWLWFHKIVLAHWNCLCSHKNPELYWATYDLALWAILEIQQFSFKPK